MLTRCATVFFCQFHGCKAVPLAHGKQRQAFSGNVVSKRFHALDLAASNRNAIWSRSLGVGDSLANVSQRPQGWWLAGFNWLSAALEIHAYPDAVNAVSRIWVPKFGMHYLYIWTWELWKVRKWSNTFKNYVYRFVWCLRLFVIFAFSGVSYCTCNTVQV